MIIENSGIPKYVVCNNFKSCLNIGDGAIVATEAVVTKDVPSYTSVVGILARLVKENVKWIYLILIMRIIETPISGLYVLEPVVHGDKRGCFLELYNSTKFKELGIENRFVQENLSKSTYGVIRGLHFQKGEYAQAKLATVLKGRVFDVAVDLRKDSPTYAQWFGVELSEFNKRLFFIPRGFAHGFSVLSEEAIFTYKCDNFYAPQSEDGINFADPTLAIDWQIKPEDVIVSEQDINRPYLKDLSM